MVTFSKGTSSRAFGHERAFSFRHGALRAGVPALLSRGRGRASPGNRQLEKRDDRLSLWPDMAIQLGLAAVVFAGFVAAFHFGWMGGGDVKMIGALALWLPLQPLMWMLVVMSLLGGVLTVVLLIDRAVRPRTTPIEVPYGVAIAIAALLVLRAPLFNHLGGYA
jgi:hypothetical protein